jgi:hypothetical protein
MSSTQLPQFEKSGMDALLSQRGKAIAPGETVTFTLVKGPSGIVLKDPVNPKAPTATFPLIAKFPESVPKPDFTKPPFSKSRLYQQDTPKVKVRATFIYTPNVLNVVGIITNLTTLIIHLGRLGR